MKNYVEKTVKKNNERSRMGRTEKWEEDALLAFERIKKELATTPVSTARISESLCMYQIGKMGLQQLY